VNGWEALGLALGSLRTARLRTVLTSVGIVLGVAAVIALVGLGNGMRTRFNQDIADTGRTIRVQSSNSDETGHGGRRPLRETDAAELREADGDIAVVEPGRRGSGVASNGTKKFRTLVNGTPSEGYLQTENRSVIAGRMVDREDDQAKARVAVVGINVVRYLYNNDISTALGSDIRIGRMTLAIIGVLSPTNDAQDDYTVIPLSTSRMLMGFGDNLSGITVMAPTANQVPAAVREITRTLDELRRISEPGARDYNATFNDVQVDRTGNLLSLFTLFTVAIAGISLLVGGIGVANIMFIAVNERTREIGIRMAVGARAGAIIKQFLSESVLLTGLGGLVGVALGLGLTLAAQPLLPRFLPHFGVPEVSLPAIAVAFGLSLVIGLTAGVLPALRAARMQPTEALRHE
jgi:putative ABC transport system permease protein